VRSLAGLVGSALCEQDSETMSGLSTTRERLLDAIVWQLQGTPCIQPETGPMRTPNQIESKAIALGVVRVVEEFTRWVEQLQRIQLEALSIYSPMVPQNVFNSEPKKP
jgi:hypothetical protein